MRVEMAIISGLWTVLMVAACDSSEADPPPLRVAVAANFAGTMRDLAADYHDTTGQEVRLSVGSTGALYSQIVNGAPYDLFIAADAQRPRRLEERGLAVTGSRRSYAIGSLVLWGDPERVPATLADLRSNRGRIAIANPATAPYGLAAEQTLRHLDLWEDLQDRIIYGQSIGQTCQFVQEGSVPLGLVARGQVPPGASAMLAVPSDYHEAIEQQMVLLADSPGTRRFWRWLQEDAAARRRIVAAGYALPSAEGNSAVDDGAGANEAEAALLGPADWRALWLTAQLAAITTVLLLACCLPLAWWLARGRNLTRSVVNAVVALPLVLPPTVMGFYLLILLGARGPVGALVDGGLAFSFIGIVIGSMLFSLPFVVQPLSTAFRALDAEVLDAAASLGAGPVDRFCTIALPQAWPGLLSATVLGFAHTVGEFGVVVMIGGSIPGETLVASVAIFEYVESSQSIRAHGLAAVLLSVSFLMLLLVYGVEWWRGREAPR